MLLLDFERVLGLKKEVEGIIIREKDYGFVSNITLIGHIKESTSEKEKTLKIIIFPIIIYWALVVIEFLSILSGVGFIIFIKRKETKFYYIIF